MLDTTTNDAITESSTPVPYYVGTVVARDDPLDINRIKVTIPGKSEGPVETLKWVAPKRLAPFGQGPGFGVYGVPPLNSRVLVKLQNDDMDYGFYVAGFFCVDCANPEYSDPDTWGFTDPGGTKLVVNSRTQSLLFRHSSGIQITMDEGGTVAMSIPGDLNVQTEGNYRHQVGGDASFEVDGNFRVNASRIDLN